jgi:hypothetical protein
MKQHNTPKRIFFRLYYSLLMIPKLVIILGYIPLIPVSEICWIITGNNLECAYDSILERFIRYRERTVWPLTLGLKPRT